MRPSAPVRPAENARTGACILAVGVSLAGAALAKSAKPGRDGSLGHPRAFLRGVLLHPHGRRRRTAHTFLRVAGYQMTHRAIVCRAAARNFWESLGPRPGLDRRGRAARALATEKRPGHRRACVDGPGHERVLCREVCDPLPGPRDSPAGVTLAGLAAGARRAPSSYHDLRFAQTV